MPTNLKYLPLIFLVLLNFKAEAQQNLAVPLTLHEPLYFAGGSPQSRIHLSAKHRPLQDTPFYGAYSQDILWNIGENSAPFFDVNYHPELFYRMQDFSWFQVLDVGLFDHRSNGLGGMQSRSVNSSYLRVTKNFEIGTTTLHWTTQLSAFYDLDARNRDYTDFVGFWKTQVSLQLPISGLIDPQLLLRFQPGGKLSSVLEVSSIEINFITKLGRHENAPYLFLQYFTGYAETLISYQRSTTAIRAGLQLGPLIHSIYSSEKY